MTITLFSTKIDVITVLIGVGILLLSMIISRVLKKHISPFLLRRLAKPRFHYDEIVVKAFTRPTCAMILFLGFYFFFIFVMASFVGVTYNFDVVALQTKSLRVAIIIYLTWGIFSASDIFGEILRVAAKKIDIETSKMVSRFLGYIFKFLVGALGTLIIISEFGYDVNGFLAGLGLGGLTFALAAQDSASNFFSGLVLIFEKPFDAGDWVVLDGGVEGSVEIVTFRSTHIRDINGTKIVIPNSQITAKHIISYKNIDMRYSDHTINFQEGSKLSSLESIICELEAFLLTDDEIINSSVIVKLSDFTVSGIAVKLAYGTTITDYMQFLEKRQSINIEVLRLVDKHGLRLNVFNTRS